MAQNRSKLALILFLTIFFLGPIGLSQSLNLADTTHLAIPKDQPYKTISAWPVQNQWTQKWRNKFSLWIQNSVDTDFFLKPGPYKNFEVDCADFIYSIYAIFSYENKLPFQFHYIGNDKKLHLAQIDSSFNKPENTNFNFNRFLKDLIQTTNTNTLRFDSELIPVSPFYFQPGIFLLTAKNQNHVWLLKSFSKFGTPLFISATSPESSFLYENRSYPSPFFTFQFKNFLNYGGFRQYKFPKIPNSDFNSPSPSSSLSPSSLPFSSNSISSSTSPSPSNSNSPSNSKQSTKLLSKIKSLFLLNVPEKQKSQTEIKELNNKEIYFEYWQKLISHQPAQAKEQLDSLLEDLCLQVRNRVNLVTDATLFLQKNQFLQAQKASTTQRDSRIKLLFQEIDDFVQKNKTTNENYKSLINPTYTTNDFCWVQWAENHADPLGHFRDLFLTNKISSQGLDSFEARWGYNSK